MKIQQILDNYCHLYGVNAPCIDYAETQYFVTISTDYTSVLSLRKPSKLLGQIVGNAMRRGVVLYVKNGRATLLLQENWRGLWAKLFATKSRTNNTPEPNISRPYKSEIFKTMQQPRARKKPAKHGFECTYRANTSMNLLGIPNIRTAPLAQ